MYSVFRVFLCRAWARSLPIASYVIYIELFVKSDGDMMFRVIRFQSMQCVLRIFHRTFIRCFVYVQVCLHAKRTASTTIQFIFFLSTVHVCVRVIIWMAEPIQNEKKPQFIHSNLIMSPVYFNQSGNACSNKTSSTETLSTRVYNFRVKWIENNTKLPLNTIHLVFVIVTDLSHTRPLASVHCESEWNEIDERSEWKNAASSNEKKWQEGTSNMNWINTLNLSIP